MTKTMEINYVESIQYFIQICNEIVKMKIGDEIYINNFGGEPEAVLYMQVDEDGKFSLDMDFRDTGFRSGYYSNYKDEDCLGNLECELRMALDVVEETTGNGGK